MTSSKSAKCAKLKPVLALCGRQRRFHSEPNDKDDGKTTEDTQPHGLDSCAVRAQELRDSLRQKSKRILLHGLPPYRAERDGMDRIAHAGRHISHDRGERLLEVDRLVDSAVLRVDLLFLGDQLLLDRSR